MAHESGLDAEIKRLLETHRTAALATVDGEGHPHVSFVPYAWINPHGAPHFVLLISGLAAHTRHIQRADHVSLLIVEQEIPGQPVHALARLSVSGRARLVHRDSVESQDVGQAYLARFPEAEQIAQLPDFRYAVITVHGVRQVAGFGAARNIPVDRFARLMCKEGTRSLGG